jgi:hypothetical protein
MFIVKATGQQIEKKGRTFRSKIDYSLFPERKCIKCHQDIFSEKTAVIKVVENIIEVRCGLDYKEYESVVCWDCRPPISMNPNSVEYNVIKFGLTETEALNMIHDRNKSPFYKTNHKDQEEYRKFQAHADFSEEKKREIQVKQNEGREKWAKRIGKDAVRKMKDSSSLEFHINKYGNELGIIKFEEKNKKTRSVPVKEIKTKEQMKLHLNSQYKINSKETLKIWFDNSIKNKSIISVLHLIENTDINKHTIPIQFGKIVFDITDLYSFFGVKHLKEFIEKRVRPNNRGYTYSAVIDGNFLRSGKEISFYRLLDEHGITIVNTNKSYPNAGKNFYDFLVDINNKQYYIEIIGREDTDYKEKMLDRSKKYGAVLVQQKYYKKFLEDALAECIEKGKYHDW